MDMIGSVLDFIFHIDVHLATIRAKIRAFRMVLLLSSPEILVMRTSLAGAHGYWQVIQGS